MSEHGFAAAVDLISVDFGIFEHFDPLSVCFSWESSATVFNLFNHRHHITHHPLFLFAAMGFILMYDITNEESFNSVQDWYATHTTHVIKK
jgi:hypothetical protein